jgi:hypothetical protein
MSPDKSKRSGRMLGIPVRKSLFIESWRVGGPIVLPPPAVVVLGRNFSVTKKRSEKNSGKEPHCRLGRQNTFV